MLRTSGFCRKEDLVNSGSALTDGTQGAWLGASVPGSILVLQSVKVHAVGSVHVVCSDPRLQRIHDSAQADTARNNLDSRPILFLIKL